ncbi:MAG: bifunctional phosphopantothenoylcysteine decarboxylase/phosphopantothenate--cysteine ligase CoaBC [Nitrospirae bacterium]|nr:bifunctional phosphopantothenoylcysteine decarboxylase/phosphopantothenate--cysteine ligase CoaBC [Nitrospirota bacterium]
MSFKQERFFKKKKVIVTAGPTREYFDPVRFISNRSSGKMGYAIAGACIRRGADVVLISGPSALRPPHNLNKFISVETTNEMRDAVFSHIQNSDIVVMAAAPADFTPDVKKKDKMNKHAEMDIRFRNTPDILSEIGQLKKRPFIVGFAAETGMKIDRAKKKLIKKNVDIIVFNDVTSAGSGFDVETNKITIIEKNKETPLPLMTKDEAAEKILDTVSALLGCS